MQNIVPLEPVDYLVIGHLACDLTPDGPRLGGTAAYAALTAHALGLSTGVVTAWAGEVPLDALEGIQICNTRVEQSTTFENIYTPDGRQQILHHIAPDIHFEDIPQCWRDAPIVHIGPIAGEAKNLLDGRFPASVCCLTPQGWLRGWDEAGRVHISSLPVVLRTVSKADAVVLSGEDLGGDEDLIESLANSCRVLAVTEGAAGSRLYWNGDLRRFRPLPVKEVDPTGAGDIFAAAFFWRFSLTHDPWAAAKFATQLASISVTRRGLDGIPTRPEIQTCLVEVI
jgi:sugar/nucleoside kinase (ribokinase family)